MGERKKKKNNDRKQLDTEDVWSKQNTLLLYQERIGIPLDCSVHDIWTIVNSTHGQDMCV